MKFKLLTTFMFFLIASIPILQASHASTPLVVQTPTIKGEGVFYEIFVRSFADSNGDGIGDLKGITEKLDYLNDGNPKTNTDLGVTGIWLMPIFKSPSYHGYDTTDYYAINPNYGTIDDLKKLVKAAHKRGIKVILDIAINHSSDEHTWFNQAKDATSNYHNWYVWAEDQGLDTQTEGAFSQNVFYESNGNHYLAIFWNKMPDFNFDNKQVRNEFVNIGKYWLRIGVDGFRLDAAKHVYENFASDHGKKAVIAKNVAWWQEFRKGLSQINKNVYLISEIWDSPHVISPHLNKTFNASFNFDLQKKIIGISNSETSEALGQYLNPIYSSYLRDAKGPVSDGTFIGNHDMDRPMSQLRRGINPSKTAIAMLLTLPGTPYIYYGDEIGMFGHKPDELIREPFLWYKNGADGKWKTRWESSNVNTNNPPSVEAQKNDPTSLLSLYRNLIHLRLREPLLQNGALEDYKVSNRSIQAYTRFTKKDRLLVLINLSANTQSVTINDHFSKLLISTDSLNKWSGTLISLRPYSTVVLKQ